MRSLIQSTPAWELSVDVTGTPYGHVLRLISLVPAARRPEQQVRFQATFSTAELAVLRAAIDSALSATVEGKEDRITN